MASKPAKRRSNAVEPSQGGEPDLVQLGAHESRNAAPEPPREDPDRLNQRMKRAQDYQGL